MFQQYMIFYIDHEVCFEVREHDMIFISRRLVFLKTKLLLKLFDILVNSKSSKTIANPKQRKFEIYVWDKFIFFS